MCRSTLAATLALQLASGRYDALSGRVFGVSDDMEWVATSGAEIQAGEILLHAVRVAWKCLVIP